MKRVFWIWALIGAAMPFLIFFPDQVFPTRWWYLAMPAGWISMHLWVREHAFFGPHPVLAHIVLPLIGYGGNAVLYGAAGYALTRWRSAPVDADRC